MPAVREPSAVQEPLTSVRQPEFSSDFARRFAKLEEVRSAAVRARGTERERDAMRAYYDTLFGTFDR